MVVTVLAGLTGSLLTAFGDARFVPVLGAGLEAGLGACSTGFLDAATLVAAGLATVFCGAGLGVAFLTGFPGLAGAALGFGLAAAFLGVATALLFGFGFAALGAAFLAAGLALVAVALPLVFAVFAFAIVDTLLQVRRSVAFVR